MLIDKGDDACSSLEFVVVLLHVSPMLLFYGGEKKTGKCLIPNKNTEEKIAARSKRFAHLWIQ